jgi:hypothetical protein
LNSPPPKPEVILTNFFAEPTVLLVPITSRAGNISLLDPILITDSIQVIHSDTIEIDRQISDHDGTYVTFKCGFSNQKFCYYPYCK